MPTLAETSIPSASVPYGTNLELIDDEDDMEQAAEPVPPYTKTLVQLADIQQESDDFLYVSVTISDTSCS